MANLERSRVMSGRPLISDESVLTRWMQLEMGRMNEGIVSERKTLGDLLKEDRPAALTKAGKVFRFRKDLVISLGERLPVAMHARLRLPVLFYFDSRVQESCYLADETAFVALVHLGELSSLRETKDGMLWIGRPLVFSLVQTYPTLVQIVMH